MDVDSRYEDKTYRNIDQSDTRPKIGIRLHIVNKRMLSPIPSHKTNPHDRERKQERKERRLELPPRKHIQSCIRGEFRACDSERKIVLAFTDEVLWEIEPA